MWKLIFWGRQSFAIVISKLINFEWRKFPSFPPPIVPLATISITVTSISVPQQMTYKMFLLSHTDLCRHFSSRNAHICRLSSERISSAQALPEENVKNSISHRAELTFQVNLNQVSGNIVFSSHILFVERKTLSIEISDNDPNDWQIHTEVKS